MWIAWVNALRTRKAAPKVLLRTRRWEISRRNSKRVSFFLQRIGRGIGRAVDVNRCDFELDRLALRRRFNQYAAGFEAAAGGNLFKHFFRDRARFDHELHALETRAVVELDERDAFGIAPRAHPAAQGDFAADR